jgi:hypothetical protein
MKPNHKSSRSKPAAFLHYHNQYGSWLIVLSPFLKHLNMHTLALLMFVGFAVLNTTRGNDAETKEPASAGNSETQVVDNRHHERAQAATVRFSYTTSGPSILWQLISSIVNDFEHAFNDPALIEYAKEQGVDTSDSPTALCQQPAPQSTTSPALPSTY